MITRHSTARLLCRLVPALLLVPTTGCGPFRRAPAEPPTSIVFTNESLEQATVYLVGAGLGFRRIGTVLPGQTDTLTVPTDVANRGGTVNVIARLLARSEVPQTGPVSFIPGEQYVIRLPSDARLLSFLRTGS